MVTTNHSLPSDSDFARLEGELFARVDRKHRHQVLRHRLVVAAGAVVLAGAGVAAGTIANPTQESRTAYCYAAAKTSSESHPTLLSSRSGMRHGENVRPSASKVALAVAQCGVLWQAGVFGTGTAMGIPKLQPCLRDDLVIAVFPRNHVAGSAAHFCENLGMSAP